MLFIISYEYHLHSNTIFIKNDVSCVACGEKL